MKPAPEVEIGLRVTTREKLEEEEEAEIERKAKVSFINFFECVALNNSKKSEVLFNFLEFISVSFIIGIKFVSDKFHRSPSLALRNLTDTNPQ